MAEPAASPSPLVPLPAQPDGVAWPTDAWPTGPPEADVDVVRLDAALDRAFAEPAPDDLGETHAVVAVHRGVLVAERYDAERGPETTLISWSMAKSILHAAVGVLVREGKLDPAARAPVPSWKDGDPRYAITLDQLLRMSPGLRFVEDYVDEVGSDCIRMLFGRGREDVAAYAESLPLEHAPETFWNYSSGTSNIVAAIAGRAVGGGAEGMEAFLRREILDRIGMKSAVLRFDDAGTWIASSFVFDTARDFARFGSLYLRDGVWEGERILPEGWVDYARTATPASSGWYGAHWWRSLDGSGRFHASGYRGQYIVVDPARDLVLVRLGNSTPEQRPEVKRLLLGIVESFGSPS